MNLNAFYWSQLLILLYSLTVYDILLQPIRNPGYRFIAFYSPSLIFSTRRPAPSSQR